jgi:hypothetical protein
MEAQNKRTPAFSSDVERNRLQTQFAIYSDPVNGLRDAAEMTAARQNQASYSALQQGSSSVQLPMTSGMYNANQIIPGSQPPPNYTMQTTTLGWGNYDMGGMQPQPPLTNTGLEPMDLSGEGLRRRRSKLRKAF